MLKEITEEGLRNKNKFNGPRINIHAHTLTHLASSHNAILDSASFGRKIVYNQINIADIIIQFKDHNCMSRVNGIATARCKVREKQF